MRRLVTMALFLSICGCGSGCGCEAGGEVDASPDSGLDAARDAEVERAVEDAARDARADSAADTGPTTCPDGETPAEWFEIPHDDEGAPCGKGCRQITWDARSVVTYDVNERSLAYTSSDDVTVGFVDLESGREIGFSIENPAGERPVSFGGPIAVIGTTIVYSTYVTDGSRGGRLWRVDAETHCRRQLGEFRSPGDAWLDVARDVDVDGTTIVWYDEREGSGQQDVFSYDLMTGVETQLTMYSCCVGMTRISDDRVAFVGWADGPYGTHVLDLPDGEPRRVWADGHEQFHPAIQGDRVVFTYQGDRPEYELDIHGVDLATDDHFIVTDHDGDQCWPDVYGDLVVWEDVRADSKQDCLGGQRQNIDIYAKDLSTGDERPVVTLLGNQSRPRIWERTVFFRYRAPEADDRLQIYSIDLPP
ncbi:MAG: hypothetical protein HYY06_22595 [Deltaproteobacteria bacterium]|nr:hypothetical protein [Deltaproteobacteria bacterium]